MTKKLLTLGMIGIFSTAFSQVGINTSNPRTIFHVDGAKDNMTTGIPTSTQQLNDVVVTNNGRLGIGTISPSQSLEVNGTSKFSSYLYAGVRGNNTPIISQNMFSDTSGNLTKLYSGVAGAGGWMITSDTGGGGDFIVSGRVWGTNSASITDTSLLTNPWLHIESATGNVGIGTSSPIVRLDARTNPGNATPGNGSIGIGETTLAAAGAGAGAVRYSTGSGGVLQYSNGTNWNTLSSNVQKSVVIASKQTSFQIPDQSVTNVTGWTSTIDINNDFNESTGVFTAPRTGNYQVSFSFTFDNGEGNYNDKSWIEAVITLSNGTRRVSAIPVPAQTNIYAGANVSFTVRLNAGATVRPTIYQFSGSRKWLRIDQAGFNNFSVVEL